MLQVNQEPAVSGQGVGRLRVRSRRAQPSSDGQAAVATGTPTPPFRQRRSRLAPPEHVRLRHWRLLVRQGAWRAVPGRDKRTAGCPHQHRHARPCRPILGAVRPAAKRACTVALGIDPSHPDHLFEALRTQLRRCENVMKLGKARLLRRSVPWD